MNAPNDHNCQQVAAWTTHGDWATRLRIPLAELVAHVAQCSDCQQRLLILAADVKPQTIACATCEDDLAAYIDIERDEGRVAAVRTYPAVWFHLWSCLSCLELYTGILVLLQAEVAGTIAPLSLGSVRSRIRLKSLLVPRPIFRSAVAIQTQLGTAWGGEDEDDALFDTDDSGYHISLDVRRQYGEWYVLVKLIPTMVGVVVITVGDTTFRALIDPHGKATVGPIPPYLLSAAHGPDMAIAIEGG